MGRLSWLCYGVTWPLTREAGAEYQTGTGQAAPLRYRTNLYSLSIQQKPRQVEHFFTNIFQSRLNVFFRTEIFLFVGLAPPPPTAPAGPPPERLLGMKASDIDKYSRVVFPIAFLSFHLMYWMIYLTISNEVVDDLVYLQMPNQNPDVRCDHIRFLWTCK